MGFDALISQMDGIIMDTVNDGVCQYRGDFVQRDNLPYILDRSYELFDADGLAQRISTIELRSTDVAGPSRTGDKIVTPTRTWDVQQTLTDDGYMRRLYVT